MKSAVLGGGNGSYAAAADLTKVGHEVRCLRRTLNDFSSGAREGYLRLLDHTGRQDIKIQLTSENIGNAVVNEAYYYKKMSKGALSMAAGEGMYKWQECDQENFKLEKLRKFVELLKMNGDLKQPVL